MCNLVYYFKLGDGRDEVWYRDERLPHELATAGVTGIRSWRTLKAAREDMNLALSPQSPESPRFMPSTHYPRGVFANWRNFFVPPEPDIVLTK